MKPANFIIGTIAIATAASISADQLTLNTQRQIVKQNDTLQFITKREKIEWDAKRTAIVVCDMWSKHWCNGASQRVMEMAPRMNKVIQIARNKGILIIHCPSGGLEFYADTPMRKLAKQAPAISTKIRLQDWCNLDREREPELPIDDSDGGCDCQPKCDANKNPMNLQQIADIEIHDQDAITDSAEAYYLMSQKGITNVIVMGVHTNMCVLGRPFSIRQMVYQGQNVLLMRDLTDTMYNSKQPPFVSHFRGTDLIVDHIERYWCPTITSSDFLADDPFVFKRDKE